MCVFYFEGLDLWRARRFPQVVVSHQQHQTQKINRPGHLKLATNYFGLPHPSASQREGPTLANALILNSPGLLDDVVGPHQTAHVPRAVVEAGERLEGTGNGVGQHQDERSHPGGGDDLGSVRFGLPRPGGQRVANGTVALQRDGHQVEGGNTY